MSLPASFTSICNGILGREENSGCPAAKGQFLPDRDAWRRSSALLLFGPLHQASRSTGYVSHLHEGAARPPGRRISPDRRPGRQAGRSGRLRAGPRAGPPQVRGHRRALRRGRRQPAGDTGAFRGRHLDARVMIEAATEDEAVRPAYWQGTVTSCERKAFDISVLQVRPEPRLDFVPGQSVAVESPHRPRLWRYYSIANAPREDGTLDFHIRLIDGGAVSMALAYGQKTGGSLRLGPPVGVLTLDTASRRDILMVAGSTGLAPLKALIEQVAGQPAPPSVQLFFCARTADGLYDLPSLDKMAAEHQWLTVVPAVSNELRSRGESGSVTDVVMRAGNWSGHDAYLAGPTEMVRDTAARLTSAGTPRSQIHIEDFGWSEP